MASHLTGLADQRRLPGLIVDLDTYLEKLYQQTEAWRRHLHGVADLWDYSTAWNRCMRKEMFTHYLRPDILHEVENSRAIHALYTTRLRLAKRGLDEETPSQLVEHIRLLANNISALESLLRAIDALPTDGQTIDGQSQENEQQSRTRVFLSQNYQGTLDELDLPTVAQRVHELDARLASANPQTFLRPRCENCERIECGCSERVRNIAAERDKWTERQDRARQAEAWCSDANQRAVSERVRERATARSIWVSPAEKIVC